jgi:hypothetical protein
MREHLNGFREAGVDQVVFIQQGGNNRHEHICESLELFASEVMPEFREGEEEREREKLERLAPAMERALERKEWLPALAEDEIPELDPLGRTIAETDDPRELERREQVARMRDAMERGDA